MLGLIDEMADDGKTVLMCTHLLLEAEGLADQVIVMDHGAGDGRRARRASSPASTGPRARVVLDADDPSVLDSRAALPFVRAYERNGVGHGRARRTRPTSPTSSTRSSRAGARLTRVEPQAPTPRRALLRHPPGAPVSRRPSHAASRRPSWVIARTDLRQLLQARDFWLPLTIVALLFFVIIPTFLLLILGSVKDANLANKLSDVVGSLPEGPAGQACTGRRARRSASYALAVYLFAPLAIIVPLTVSSAVGAHTIVGERERGSGEFLAHSPATERQIYLGKLMASLIPGYFTAAMGFLLYSLVVNLIVGPQARRLVLPDDELVDPDALGAAAVHRPRVGGDPRHLGAGVERGRRAAGVGAGDAAADRHRVRRVEQHALPRARAPRSSSAASPGAARSSRCGARRRPCPANASSAWAA